MRVAGIIAEYNPLHNGHVYHIEQTRAVTGCEYIIVVMSGDYVQRGEPAIADKFTRAQWALLAGADVVLELPTVYALCSAERFAYGGIRTLAATGILDTLCFGSETPDLSALKQAADMLAHEPALFREKLREQLSMGKSYPRARYDALQACGASKEVLAVLREPNSILGVEYIRFLSQLAENAVPVAIHRVGGGYNESAMTGTYSSATAIREALNKKEPTAFQSMPMYVGARFGPGGVPPISLLHAQQLILYALRRMSSTELKLLPDVQEGMENILFRAAQNVTTLEALYDSLKSKRYTMARCKRISLSALLGITKSLLHDSMNEDAGYLRVLGFRREARPLLSLIGKKCTAPLIMRRADCEHLSDHARTLLEKDLFAHDIYALLNPNEQPIRDFSQPPITI